jgi:hypothetical protein
LKKPDTYGAVAHIAFQAQRLRGAQELPLAILPIASGFSPILSVIRRYRRLAAGGFASCMNAQSRHGYGMKASIPVMAVSLFLRSRRTIRILR